MKNKPLVSVVIPVYNGVNYIAEAIESVLNQTYDNIEIIVVNDGSTDSTMSVVESYLPAIQVISKPNGGTSSALNRGIRASQGAFIGWLSHDDIYECDMVYECLQALNRCPNANGVYSKYGIIDEYGIVRTIVDLPLHYSREEKYIALFKSNYIHGCTTLFRRSIFTDLGLYNENLKYTQDYDMWFRILRDHDIQYIDKALVRGRCYNAQRGELNKKQVASDAMQLAIKEVKAGYLRKALQKMQIINTYNSNEAYSYIWLGEKLPYVGANKKYIAKCYFSAISEERSIKVILAIAKSIIYKVYIEVRKQIRKNIRNNIKQEDKYTNKY